MKYYVCGCKDNTRQVVLQVFRPLLDEEAVFLIKRMGFRV